MTYRFIVFPVAHRTGVRVRYFASIYRDTDRVACTLPVRDRNTAARAAAVLVQEVRRG